METLDSRIVTALTVLLRCSNLVARCGVYVEFRANHAAMAG
jgi:hypothetical protein